MLKDILLVCVVLQGWIQRSFPFLYFVRLWILKIIHVPQKSTSLIEENASNSYPAVIFYGRDISFQFEISNKKLPVQKNITFNIFYLFKWNFFFNTEDANSTKIWLPLKYVFLYGNFRACYATLSLLLFPTSSSPLQNYQIFIFSKTSQPNSTKLNRKLTQTKGILSCQYLGSCPSLRGYKQHKDTQMAFKMHSL